MSVKFSGVSAVYRLSVRELLKKESTIDTLMTETGVTFSSKLVTRFISETDFSVLGAICTKLHKSSSYYFFLI